MDCNLVRKADLWLLFLGFPVIRLDGAVPSTWGQPCLLLQLERRVTLIDTRQVTLIDTRHVGCTWYAGSVAAF